MDLPGIAGPASSLSRQPAVAARSQAVPPYSRNSIDMNIISNSDGGGDDGTGDGDGDDACGNDDGGGDDGDGIALVARSVFARSQFLRSLRSPHRRPSIGRPHSELVGAARHMTGRSRLQLLAAPAPLPRHRWRSAGKLHSGLAGVARHMTWRSKTSVTCRACAASTALIIARPETAPTRPTIFLSM